MNVFTFDTSYPLFLSLSPVGKGDSLSSPLWGED